MSSGFAKQDNRIVTLFLFIQAFDILLDCQLIRVIRNNNNNYSNNFEVDTWIQHITVLTTMVLWPLSWVAAYCHSF